MIRVTVKDPDNAQSHIDSPVFSVDHVQIINAKAESLLAFNRPAIGHGVYGLYMIGVLMQGSQQQTTAFFWIAGLSMMFYLLDQ